MMLKTERQVLAYYMVVTNTTADSTQRREARWKDELDTTIEKLIVKKWQSSTQSIKNYNHRLQPTTIRFWNNFNQSYSKS